MLAGDSYRIWNDNKTPNSLLTPNQPLTRTFQLVNTFPCKADSISPSWQKQAFARLAFIFMVVHVAGGLVLTAFYYNFTAFEVYIMSLFWAAWLEKSGDF